MEILSVDTGADQTKWYLPGKQGKFQSAVAHPVSIMTSGLGIEEKKYTCSGKTYVVGSSALNPLCKQDYTRDRSFFIRKVPFLVAKAADEAGIDLASVKTLVLGLSIINFRENSKILQEMMSDVEINGIRYNQRLVVIPQGVGALHAFAKEKHTNKNDIGLVIDVGSNTCLVIAHNKYHATPEGSREYTAMGISRAAEMLSAQLREDYGLQCSLIETLEIMRNAVVVGVNGEYLDISNEIKHVLSSHAQTVVETLQTDFGQAIGRYNHLILAGGGANLLKQHFPDQWSKKTIVVDDPEFANARGYYYAAQEAQ